MVLVKVKDQLQLLLAVQGDELIRRTLPSQC